MPSFPLTDQTSRHDFRFRESDASNLTDWSSGRPRLDKDFKLGRINKPSENGVVVDCTKAWDWLASHADETIASLDDPSVKASNLILGEFPACRCWLQRKRLIGRHQLFTSNSSQGMQHSV